MKAPLWPLLAALLEATSGCPSAKDACGGCGPAERCDPTARSCVPALPAGSPCATGGAPCADGTVCEAALATPVCAPPCDPTGRGQGCASGQGCFELIADGGALAGQGGAPLGVCGSIAEGGGACGLTNLPFCDQGLACILVDPAATVGVCDAPCDPAASPDPCSSPNACLAVFPDPSQGICATPIAAGSPCDDATERFCPKGQICLGNDGGSCYLRCAPGDGGSAGCPELEDCVTPTDDPRVGICAQPVPDGQPCDPGAGIFCGAASICVGDATGLHCHPLCGPGGSCPATESCLPVQGTSASACG